MYSLKVSSLANLDSTFAQPPSGPVTLGGDSMFLESVAESVKSESGGTAQCIASGLGGKRLADYSQGNGGDHQYTLSPGCASVPAPVMGMVQPLWVAGHCASQSGSIPADTQRLRYTPGCSLENVRPYASVLRLWVTRASPHLFQSVAGPRGAGV